MIGAAPRLLFFFSFLLLFIFVPGIGLTVNGSRRWIAVGPFSFQPSEFVKYVIPLYYIFLALQKSSMAMTSKEFLKWLWPVAVPMVLILVEPNNGTVGVIGIELLVLFFLTKVPAKLWVIPMVALLVLGSVFALSMPYVRARIDVYMHPEKDLKGRGHQPYQAKIASGSGGLFGRGPGKSLQKFSYLPEAQNDYIAAIFAEEFGFLGMVILIGGYAAFAYLGFSVAYQAFDSAGFLLASIITFLISFQAFMNLGVVSGLLPSTGLNLPFFSQGGSSLIANIAGVGLLMNISYLSEKKGARIAWGK